ncbi:MAG: hypothetical protein AAGG07_04640 [Planctomycetota bacterium]
MTDPGPNNANAEAPTAPSTPRSMRDFAAGFGDEETVILPPPPQEADGEFARVGAHELTGLDKFDPEAGYSDYQKKVTLRKAVSTSFGQLIISGVLMLTGIALTIMAATVQTLPWIIAAAVVLPPAIVVFRKRYKRWVRNRTYLFRLCQSLGEDVSNW